MSSSLATVAHSAKVKAEKEEKAKKEKLAKGSISC
jgi:hypothetical protein